MLLNLIQILYKYHIFNHGIIYINSVYKIKFFDFLLPLEKVSNNSFANIFHQIRDTNMGHSKTIRNYSAL